MHVKGKNRKIDWAGVVSLIFCIVPLLLALTWVTNYGWSSPRVESLLALAILMLGVFLYSETKAVEPLLPLSLSQIMSRLGFSVPVPDNIDLGYLSKFLP